MRVTRVTDSVSRAFAEVRPVSSPDAVVETVATAIGLMGSGELAPAWARCLVLGYAMGRHDNPEVISALWAMVFRPPAPVKRRKTRLTL
ncbi:hypothetical protein UFOVP786_19 [uncultured Caudovirales phage]|uniref:Uncharacterized protein n=1 Tax=uncultured Caudovirales phage TaxID=2100421 RepID=A0A6J5NSJ0_9CAUD|nr:hypothetical protein UFOVP786_19 [uncultured Caudovirales phage]